MRRMVVSALLLAVAATFTGCSSSKMPAVAPMPNIAGPWEFIASSTSSPGFSTGIETALQEAQVFSSQTGTFVPTGQISAGGAQVNAPTKPGAYRLFVYALDNHGKGAYANIPFYVDAKPSAVASTSTINSIHGE